jgi:DNA repair exonuclease SbcCD nuclease subunit|tara:strand:+ start:793 stop:1842 length:1050 start_codon:yes stop_codon:yes gene_type:complete
MKIAILNDTHCGIRNSSDVFLDYQQKFYEDVFFPYCIEHDIKQVLHLGDYYDHRKFVNFKALNHNRAIFLDPLKNNGMMMDIIPGNHDVYYKNTNELNSLKELLGYYINNVNIIMKPTVMKYGSLDMALVPWINNENYDEYTKWIKSCKAKVIGAHLELNNFEMMRGIPAHSGMSADLFSHFDTVLSGHYHTKSSKGNVHYLGSQMEFYWNDSDDPKYFHILDTETLEITPILNPHRMFYKLEWRNGCDADLSQIKDKFVKIVVTEKSDPYLFDKFVDEVNSYNPHELKIAETFDEFMGENVDDSAISIEDTPTLLNDYVDAVDTELNKSRIKSIIKALYTEASNMEIV